MKRVQFLETLRVDIYRYLGKKSLNPLSIVKCLYFHVSLMNVILLRAVQSSQSRGIFFLPITIPLKIILNIIRVFNGIHIHSKCKIGEGFYIGHFGCIFIGATSIGKFCNVSQEVTIGLGGRNTEKSGLPTIGDYVWIGPGAKIFGKHNIGNNVMIGANTVVTKDIPDNAIVMGNPSRIVGYQEKRNTYLDNIDYYPE